MKQIFDELESVILKLHEEQRNKYIKLTEPIKQKISSVDLNLALIGNFNSGKSTFLNTLLKTSLLTMDDMPTTAIPTYIDWNEKKQNLLIKVTDRKGEVYQLDQAGKFRFTKKTGIILPEAVGEMIDYLTTTNKLIEIISKIQISFPETDGYKGFCIIDTPGINPGDEQASSHILQTQTVLREQADAAIVLFPSYCVYTKDFSEFLELNAKHLLADSIFIVTKIDLVPTQKEQDKLLHFVKAQLEKNFCLNNPKVYGCSAMSVLHDYESKNNIKSVWTMSFEKMMADIFGELQIRRQYIISKKIKKMLETLTLDLKTDIQLEQQQMLTSQENFQKYSILNLQKEYEEKFFRYRAYIQTEEEAEKKKRICKIQEKVNITKEQAKEKCKNLKNMTQLKAFIETEYPELLNELENQIQIMISQAKIDIETIMNNLYETFKTEVDTLLKKYQYNIGDFDTFAQKQKAADTSIKEVLETKVITDKVKSINFTLKTLGTGFLTSTVLLNFFGPLGILAGGWIGSKAAFHKQKVDILNKLSKSFHEYEITVIETYQNLLSELSKNYSDTGWNLLSDYQNEYHIFWNRKEKELKVYSQNIRQSIKNNEQNMKTIEKTLEKLIV